VVFLGLRCRCCRSRWRRKEPSNQWQRAQSALGHCERRARSEDKSKRGQGRPKHRAPRAHFSLAQASLDALDLGRIEATHVACLMQEAQALAEEFCGRFRVARFPIG
jgi:hypothetical protein